MTQTEDDRLITLGRTNFRNEGRPFGMRAADRRHHVYVVGSTGTGKSTFLENLIRQDIEADQGVALLDPHGDLVGRVLASVPGRRRAEVIYVNVPDAEHPVGFNPLERVAATKRGLAASGLLQAFKMLWADSWGPRVEHLLRNALLALLEQPESTLADVLRLLDEQEYRRDAAASLTNRAVRRFWLREYEAYPARFRAEAIAPLQNKVGAFLTDPVLAGMLTQPKSAFDLRAVMDEGKILLVNLAKGRIGEDAASLLGALLVSRIGLAALSRADMPEAQRRDFWVYLDEFQSFTTLSLATMLSELRKYRVSMTLAHQYLGQLDEAVRSAILGNVGTIVSFRVGLDDAEILEKVFAPKFRDEDLAGLPNHSIYLRLMVNGAPSLPFSAETLRPPEKAGRHHSKVPTG